MRFDIPLTREVLQAVAHVDRLRGGWDSIQAIPADRLERLREAATAQSVAASCRLAGIRVPDAEVAGLLLDPALPVRDKSEILGLARALVWPRLDAGLLSSDALRRLHALVLGAEGDDPEPSPWRAQPATREAFSSDGTALGRVFPTLPPRLIPDTIDDLLTWLELELRSAADHPLLVIGTFTLAFLAVSPFDKANGRVSRLLMMRLLQRMGYAHVGYASLDRILEETRDRYYDAYDAGTTRLWTDAADLLPWLSYFLELLVEQAHRVRTALDVEARAMRLSPLQRSILETVRDHGDADAALLRAATGANRNTLKDNMRRLVRLGLLQKTGERRGTRYRLAAGASFGPKQSAEPNASPAPVPRIPRRPVDH